MLRRNRVELKENKKEIWKENVKGNQTTLRDETKWSQKITKRETRAKPTKPRGNHKRDPREKLKGNQTPLWDETKESQKRTMGETKKNQGKTKKHNKVKPRNNEKRKSRKMLRGN